MQHFKVFVITKRFAIELSCAYLKALLLFDDFYLLPTIGSFTLNTYKYGARYLYTRYIDIFFLWFCISFQIQYGTPKDLKSPTNFE